MAQRKARFQTSSGIELKNAFKPEDTKEIDYERDIAEPGEYPLFTVIRSMAKTGTEAAMVQAAKTLMSELRRGQHLPAGWATTAGSEAASP